MKFTKCEPGPCPIDETVKMRVPNVYFEIPEEDPAFSSRSPRKNLMTHGQLINEQSLKKEQN